MRYRVLHVGRRAQDPLLEAADDYAARLSRYVPTELVRLRDGSLTSERDEILSRLKSGSVAVVLDEHGKNPSTVELKELIARWQRQSVRGVDFVIGGADGLHDEVRARAQHLLSLSRMTLPHRLALVVLLEQIYRAHTLLAGLPYHRA